MNRSFWCVATYMRRLDAGAGGLRSVVAATAQQAGRAIKSGKKLGEAELLRGRCYDGA